MTMDHIKINPVPISSNPSSSREISHGVPCKFSLRFWGEGKHLGDFDTYFEAQVFAAKFAQEHNAEIKDNTKPHQRQ